MKKERPLVGITPYRHDNGDRYVPEGYLKGLEDTGCEPYVIDYMTFDPADLPALADKLDGMLFSGGPDVNPEVYGMKKWPETGTLNPNRDEIETKLLQLLLPKKTPILGICRGLQLINAGMGGTLIQDVPSVYGNVHQQSGDGFCHEINLVPGSRVANIFGGKLNFMVDSYHHQSAARVADGLVISGWSKDGVTEALEAPGDRFLVCLQWHPEKTLGQDEYSVMPFIAFREAIDKFTEEN